MRILGLDYGDKTIGVAMSDLLGITAQGIEIVRRTDENSFKKSIARLREIIREYEIKTIVLGYPKNMDNSEGIRCQKTLEFRDRLQRNFKSMEIILWDERLSTVATERNLIASGMNFFERKEVIDKIAAVYILQGYLDYLNNKNGEGGYNNGKE
ncbi:Holliday junction resolvase RuvX [Anaeropeptidivorans aminofermentans]|jgi:putative Holliday junction resolvase|uniref:Holliday junction resolvase RuvX n=1 Tax=Anaeropeptidivorans aminofermentans TaxID=2934315 RepID=UPI000EB97AE5|nr:Holliday junction resolvase RuvX [Anaeropeptidivorans aminofermentans]MBE6011265.1 Holliday junction resolvase RuvX [Lachnospiraceae bacterium]HAQ39984.1 Holliday junction resolvase RuvX [Clostridiales bacterium]